MTKNEAIEAFHTQFLRMLGSDPNKALYTVKGGQNLRFFYESVRHSDDLDMDVSVTSKETLKKKVDKILASPALAKALLLYGIEATVGTSKQTDTTQRWKVELRVKGIHDPIPTKIEFSRREQAKGASADAQVDLIDEAIGRRYGTPRVAVSHYKLKAAIAQKVAALANRKEPQARDVFDLAILLERHGKELGALVPLPGLKDLSAKALKQAEALTYDMYLAQVVPYLDRSKRDEYKSKAKWEAMQFAVAQALVMMS